MKKLIRKRITAAGIIAGAMAASSGAMISCAWNQTENVYGPPEEVTIQSDQNIVEGVYGPPSGIAYSEEENLVETVYGPPEDFETEPVTPEPVTPQAVTEEPEFDPSLNEIEDVYGPPEDFE